MHSVELIYHISILVVVATAISILVSVILMVIVHAICPTREVSGVSAVVLSMAVALVPVAVLQDVKSGVVLLVVVSHMVKSVVVEIGVHLMSIAVVLSEVVLFCKPIQPQHQVLNLLSRWLTWLALFNQLTMKTSSFSTLQLVKQKWTLNKVSH